MGYYANGGGSLHIKKENFGAVKEAVRLWMQEDAPGWEPDADILRFFDWFGFEAELDERGDVDPVWFPENKIRVTAEFLEQLAPWVEDHSRLYMTGEDGDHWLWAFKDHQLHECQGFVVYEGDPYEDA